MTFGYICKVYIKLNVTDHKTDEVYLYTCFHIPCDLQTYNKEVVRDDSHLALYSRSRKTFNARQLAALKMLYKWRDVNARELDESTT